MRPFKGTAQGRSLKETGTNTIFTSIWVQYERISAVVGTIKVRDTKVYRIGRTFFKCIEGKLAFGIPKVRPPVRRVTMAISHMRILAANDLAVGTLGPSLM